jgi:hypothetical protein
MQQGEQRQCIRQTVHQTEMVTTGLPISLPWLRLHVPKTCNLQHSAYLPVPFTMLVVAMLLC